jgi:hypothetical protein
VAEDVVDYKERVGTEPALCEDLVETARQSVAFTGWRNRASADQDRQKYQVEPG